MEKAPVSSAVSVQRSVVTDLDIGQLNDPVAGFGVLEFYFAEAARSAAVH
jgi:hypothetical protein